jgi:hypothetical protein
MSDDPKPDPNEPQPDPVPEPVPEPVPHPVPEPVDPNRPVADAAPLGKVHIIPAGEVVIDGRSG